MEEAEEPSTGTPLWGAGSSADAVGQQTNEEAPGAAMRRVKKRVDDDARRRLDWHPDG